MTRRENDFYNRIRESSFSCTEEDAESFDRVGAQKWNSVSWKQLEGVMKNNPRGTVFNNVVAALKDIGQGRMDPITEQQIMDSSISMIAEKYRDDIVALNHPLSEVRVPRHPWSQLIIIRPPGKEPRC